MSPEQKIIKDAIRIARRLVKRGFWYGYAALSDAKAAEVSRAGTLWYADLTALEEITGRKLTKADHWLWETALRAEIRRFAPMETA